MRRLANSSREDTYKSKRDYQELHERRAVRFAPSVVGTCKLVFRTKLTPDARGRVCWGGYLLSNVSGTIKATLASGDRERTIDLKVEPSWQRFGAILHGQPEGGDATLTLEWKDRAATLDVWGLGVGRPNIPRLQSGEPDLTLLDQSHLIPETFYLIHQDAVDAKTDADISKRFRLAEGSSIRLKKCSYCGRLLPVDPSRLGMLAFHKHNAKISKHQNECRSCKKWRINDDLNKKRSTDQLHESSVITRERKVFLRDSEIFQEIKERTGAGLKSKVWERFGRRCFRCSKGVALDGFQLDHTRPLAYLWPIDEYATCLCAECNNEKKEKFPVEFYKPQELARLSAVTGLPLSELKKKELNKNELAKMLADLPRFARLWEPRTFLAMARKIRELRPEIDLFGELKKLDNREFLRLKKELRDRPPPVERDDE